MNSPESTPKAAPAEPLRQRKKAAEATAISMLPAFLRAWQWGQFHQLSELTTGMSDALAATHPQISKKIREMNRIAPVKQPPPLPQNLISLEVARHGLEQVILPQAVREQCKAIVQEHGRRDDLRSVDLEPRHKVMLHGEPGNGKTMLAEALAHELDVPFLRVKYSGLIASYLGETGKNLSTIMEYAQTAPCLLFLDEFDAMAMARGGSADVGEMRRITNQLLISIERLPSTCVFVAATNVYDQIDAAIKRRFDFVIELTSPNRDLRHQCASSQLAPERTQGKNLLPLSDRIADMNLKNLFEVVELCRRIRRDLVLNEGMGIEAAIDAAAQQ